MHFQKYIFLNVENICTFYVYNVNENIHYLLLMKKIEIQWENINLTLSFGCSCGCLMESSSFCSWPMISAILFSWFRRASGSAVIRWERFAIGSVGLVGLVADGGQKIDSTGGERRPWRAVPLPKRELEKLEGSRSREPLLQKYLKIITI